MSMSIHSCLKEWSSLKLFKEMELQLKKIMFWKIHVVIRIRVAEETIL